jgi:hypothetical protein
LAGIGPPFLFLVFHWVVLEFLLLRFLLSVIIQIVAMGSRQQQNRLAAVS